MSDLDFKELDKLSNELIEFTQETFPKECKKHIIKQGGLQLKIARRAYKADIMNKKTTGALIKGLKRGKPYKWQGEDFQVRIKNTAKHAHLFELGHSVKTKDGVKFVAGRYTMRAAQLMFEQEFYSNTEQFVDELLGVLEQ